MVEKPPISGKSIPTYDFSSNPDARGRLSEVIDRIGSLVKAGEIAGVSDEQIARWRDGKAKPNFYGIAALTYAAGKTLDWLATGEEGVAPLAELPAAIPDDIAFVQKLEVDASAGNGAVAAYDPGADYIAFQASWLRANDVNPAAARVLNVHGDSMEPTIRHGDVLLVDTSIDHIKDNAIYVLTWDDSVFVKRVHKRINGALQLISDNTLYPPEDITKADADQLHIAGRVVWYGRFT